MSEQVRTLLVAALVSLSAAGAVTGHASAAGATTIDACTTLDAPGSYVLTADIVTSEDGDCITVAAADVTIDGDGHTIDGTWDRSQSRYVVGVNVTESNVTVRNLDVVQFSRGINVVGGSDGNAVVNVTIEDAWFGVRLGDGGASDDNLVTESSISYTSVGVRVSPGGRNNAVTDNTFGLSWHRDVRVLSATGTTLRGNDAHQFEVVDSTGTEIEANAVGRLRLSNADSATVTNNTVVDGGIDLLDGSDSNFVSHNVVRGGLDGFDVRNSHENSFVNNTVEHPVQYGYNLDHARSNTIRDSRIVESGWDGISIYGGSDNLLADSTIRRGDGVGVYLAQTDMNAVVDTTIVSNADGGVHLWRTGPNLLEANEVRDNDQAGVFVEESEGVDVRATSLTDNQQAGVRIERSQEMEVEDIVARSNGGTGVRLHGTSDSTVHDAVAEGNDRGVWLSRSPDNNVSNASVNFNEYAGVLVAASNRTTIDGVETTGNRFGVHVSGSSRTAITNVTAVQNDWGGIRVDAGGSETPGPDVAIGNHLENVTAFDNDISGVRLAGTRDTTVENATVEANRYGVWLSGATDSRLSSVAATDASGWEFLATAGTTNATATNLTLGPEAVVSVVATDVALGSVERQPWLPEGYVGIERFVRTQPTSSSARLDLAVSYEQETVSDADTTEDALELWRFDGEWSTVSNSAVYSEDNYVNATLTEFGLIAPLGERTNATTGTESQNATTARSARPSSEVVA